jgi:hypothetical protein
MIDLTLARAVVAAAAVVLGHAPPRAPRTLPPVARSAPTAADAVSALVGGAGGVVAFGEVHVDAATAGTRSALARFTDEILPVLAGRAAHLVVETWVARGDCGETEARVTKDIERTTERPPETESEIVRLLRRAKESGVVPHILEIGCDEYRAISGSDGGAVDYDRLLTITGRALATAIHKAALLPRPPGRPLVLVYGGALHNDLHPQAALAAYSFGPDVSAFMHGAYREIDLYVPALVERLPALRAERWFPVWQRAAKPERATIIERSARSAIVLFGRP